MGAMSKSPSLSLPSFLVHLIIVASAHPPYMNINISNLELHAVPPPRLFSITASS